VPHVPNPVQAKTGMTDGVNGMNVPFAWNSNLTDDDMAELQHQGICLDADDNESGQKNSPISGLQVEAVPLSWKSDSIICPR
jgi:hypothetical protein